MENAITRFVALLCALGSSGLFWTLGVFIVVPWRQGRMFALDRFELQVIVAPLLLGIAVAWAALHLFALADQKDRPRAYAATRALLVGASIAAFAGGIGWTLARIT